MRFTKLQATGNDFVLLDQRQEELPEEMLPSLAQSLCDRHFGIGADGLLLLMGSEHGDFRMRMFNPDGTEDMCGNGLRCLVRYLMEEGQTAEANWQIETIAGLRCVQGTIADGKARISVNMGKPIFEPAALPALFQANPIVDQPLEVNGERHLVTCLSLGTPHACLFPGAPVEDETFLRLSPLIEQHPCFPERTSVLWVHPLSADHLLLRIWERAVGETLSCGTGACAALVAAHLKGLSRRSAVIESRGGVLEVVWQEDDTLLKSGPAEIVFTGWV
jgi:diaminopimelate epimerase